MIECIKELPKSALSCRVWELDKIQVLPFYDEALILYILQRKEQENRWA